MKLNTALATLAVLGATVLPLVANAQDSKGRRNEDRQSRDKKQRDERNRKDQSNRNKDRWNDRRNDTKANDRWNDDRNGSNSNNRWNDNRNDSNPNNRWNDRRDSESDRRQDTKNEWRNIAIGSGLVGVLGLLKHDNTLTFAGAAGALYSLDRYEKDRKSQNAQDRGRSSYFSRDHFTRDGDRYDRKTVTKNGKRYYQFIKSR
ncbi:hypothetical protein EON79_06510 [bacterium]|nr:MAG: hypothetical protein EON79_06510 [bacterium]